jgi:hypothetical protein
VDGSSPHRLAGGLEDVDDGPRYPAPWPSLLEPGILGGTLPPAHSTLWTARRRRSRPAGSSSSFTKSSIRASLNSVPAGALTLDCAHQIQIATRRSPAAAARDRGARLGWRADAAPAADLLRLVAAHVTRGFRASVSVSDAICAFSHAEKCWLLHAVGYGTQRPGRSPHLGGSE